MLVNAGGPKTLDVHGFTEETLDFDSVDWVGFAAMAAAASVGFIAVMVCVWIS